MTRLVSTEGRVDGVARAVRKTRAERLNSGVRRDNLPKLRLNVSSFLFSKE